MLFIWSLESPQKNILSFLQFLLQLPISFSSASTHSSFLTAPPFPLSSLLYLVHLPCHTEVRVKGQLPGCATEPVLEGADMYPSCVLSLSFISPDNTFPPETASFLLVVTNSLHSYVHTNVFCVLYVVWLYISESVCVGWCFFLCSNPLPAPFAHPCLFTLLSFLLSSCLPFVTFFSHCLTSSIDSLS